MIRSWRRRGQHLEARLAELALQGAWWPKQRKHEAGMADSPLCPQCFMEPEDAMHACWKCRTLDQAESDKIKDTQSMKLEAEEGAKKYPCFWLRALTPAEWTVGRILA